MRRLLALVTFLPVLTVAQVQLSTPAALDGYPRRAISSGARELLAFPFNQPGCYPTSAVLGAAGTATRTIAFTRTGTKSCGALTCQADELCVTASGATSSTGESLTVTPTFAATWQPPGWCVCVTAEATGRSWSSASLALWSIGANGAANSAQLLALNTSILDFRVYDASATVRQSNSYVHSFADGSTHRIAACDDAGVLFLYSDGTQVATKNTGGTGLISSWPSTFYVGKRSTGIEWVGALRDVRLIRTADHTKCGAGF